MEYLNLRTMERSEGLQPSDLDPQVATPQTVSNQDQEYNMSQDRDISVPENVILQTKNYGRFRLDPLNRPIRPDKLDRLHDAVQAKNLLHLFPIVVTRQFVVIDGQHRLKVAQTLDTPIYYIVSSQMQIEDAAHVNANTDNWNLHDYLHHWCGLGLQEYIKLRDFHAGHRWLPLGLAAQLCFYGDQRSHKDKRMGNKIGIHRMFETGTYLANDISFAGKVCTMAKDFSTWFKFWKSSSFLHTVRNLASNADYDHKRMIQKMQWQSSKLVRAANVDGYLAILNGIYNFKVKEDERVLLRRLNSNSAKYRVDRKPNKNTDE